MLTSPDQTFHFVLFLIEEATVVASASNLVDHKLCKSSRCGIRAIKHPKVWVVTPLDHSPAFCFHDGASTTFLIAVSVP